MKIELKNGSYLRVETVTDESTNTIKFSIELKVDGTILQVSTNRPEDLKLIGLEIQNFLEVTK